MILKNYTSKIIILMTEEENNFLVLDPEEKIPYVKINSSPLGVQEFIISGESASCPAYRFGKPELIDMPEHEHGVMCIVAADVALHPENKDREDIISPGGRMDGRTFILSEFIYP